MSDDDDYPQARVKRDELYAGRIILYKPDIDNLRFDSLDNEELPWGSLGIFISMSSNWEKFLVGHEPIEVLFGTLGRIIRIYMDEIELA